MCAETDRAATLERAPLLFAHPTPYAGVLAGLERPAQALLRYRAAPTDRLGLLDLQQGRAGRPDREKQLRVLVSAGSTVAPVHGGYAPCPNGSDTSITCVSRPREDRRRQRTAATGAGGRTCEPPSWSACEYFHELPRCQEANPENGRLGA